MTGSGRFARSRVKVSKGKGRGKGKVRVYTRLTLSFPPRQLKVQIFLLDLLPCLYAAVHCARLKIVHA